MSVENLSPLLPEDVYEKIEKNAQEGIDIKELRQRLFNELQQRKWEAIKNQINIQSISEQIEYIDRKISTKEDL